MSNNVRTRTLLIVVIALAAIWYIGDRYGMRAKVRTFRDVVMTLDTADITSFTIEARRRDRIPLAFEKHQGQWRLVADGDTIRVENTAVLDVLGPLGDMRVKRLVGTMDQVKDRYELTDSSCERLSLRFADGTTRHLRVGRSTFGPNGPWSYVNVTGEKEVFAIEGKLSLATEMKVDDWRPRTIVNGDPANWTRVHFTFYDNDYSFIRSGDTWNMDGMTVDTMRVRKYLGSLAVSKAHLFAKGVSVNGLPEVCRLEVTDTSRKVPIVVRVFATPAGRMILYSSLNPDNLMWFDAERELPRMFRERNNWLPGATPAGPPQ
jgi:hypothetical protein